jgi:rod shape-determining protein MreB
VAARRFGVELSPDHVAVWARGDGLVVEEPAVLARQQGSGRALAFGTAALELASGRSQDVELSWPLGTEELADVRAAQQLLRQLILRVVGRLLFSRHELMLGVSAELSSAGRRSLLEVALASGARMAHIMDLPLAAALGAGLPVASWTPVPLLFVVPQAAQAAIITHEGLLAHGAVRPPQGDLGQLVQSWESEAGLTAIAVLVSGLVQELNPRLQLQARDSGLAIAGRGVNLALVGERLTEATGLSAHLLPDPNHCVAKGTELALERIDALGGQGLLYLR